MPDIKQITLPSGTTYDLRDSRVDSLVSQATKWLGVTTTAISDGSTINVIDIGGESVTVENGNIVSYNNMEFIWNGTITTPCWQEFGSSGSLKALAFKDGVAVSTQVPATFTTTGTVSAPTILKTAEGTTAKVTGITSVGSMPTYTVADGVLTITAGSAPTADTEKTFKTGDATYEASAPTLSASTVVATNTNVSGTVTYTP